MDCPKDAVGCFPKADPPKEEAVLAESRVENGEALSFGGSKVPKGDAALDESKVPKGDAAVDIPGPEDTAAPKGDGFVAFPKVDDPKAG